MWALLEVLASVLRDHRARLAAKARRALPGKAPAENAENGAPWAHQAPQGRPVRAAPPVHPGPPSPAHQAPPAHPDPPAVRASTWKRSRSTSGRRWTRT